MAGNLGGLVKRLQDIMRQDAGINGDAQRIEQIVWMLFLKVYSAKEEEWELDDEDYVSIIPEEYRWQNWAHEEKQGDGLTGEDLLDFVNNMFKAFKELEVTSETPLKKSIVKTVFEDTNQYMKDGILLRQMANELDAIQLNQYEEIHALGDIYETILKDLQSAGHAGEFYTPRAVTDFMAKMIEPKLGEKMADFACGTGGFITSWLKELEPQIQTTEDRESFIQSVYGIEKKQFPYMLAITNLLLHDIDEPRIFHDNSLAYNVLDYTEKDSFDKILMNPPYGGSEGEAIKNNFPEDLANSETADLFMSVIMYRLKKNGRAAVVLPDGFLFGTDNTKTAIKKKLMSEFNLHTIIRLPGSVFAPYTSITTNLLFFDNTEPTKEVWFYRLDMPEGYKHFSKTKPMKLEHFQPVMDWWKNREEREVKGWPKAKRYTAEEIQEGGYNLDLCGFPHEEEEILDPLDLIQSYQEHSKELITKIGNSMSELITRMESSETKHSIDDIGINAFSKLAEITIQFPEAMKKSLLQYAIQGKLVEQRADEGTAQDLIKDIQAEKKRLIAEKKIKKPKALPPITEEEIPFDIPEGWEWVRINDISITVTKGTTPKGGKNAYIEKGIGFLRAENLLGYDKIDLTNVKYIDEDTHRKFLSRSILIENDILISIAGTLGRTAVVRRENLPLNTNQAIAIIRLVNAEYVDIKYLIYALNCPSIQKELLGQKKITAIPNLTLEIIGMCCIPFPPLAEQHRIVAKLEELLPFCDQLIK